MTTEQILELAENYLEVLISDDCDIISINNLGSNQWEIWARFHQKYSYGMEYVNSEIEECLNYMDAN